MGNSNNFPALLGNPGTGKKEDYISWDDFFMASAHLAAQRCKDSAVKSGACIVDQLNRIVGVGYNGLPSGCNYDDFPRGDDDSEELKSTNLYVVHATANAILNNSCNLTNCKLYVEYFPCNECVKLIIQSGIKSIIYLSENGTGDIKIMAAKKMLNTVGIKYRKHIPNSEEIVIEFGDISWDKQDQTQTPVKVKR